MTPNIEKTSQENININKKNRISKINGYDSIQNCTVQYCCEYKFSNNLVTMKAIQSI